MFSGGIERGQWLLVEREDRSLVKELINGLSE